MPRLFLRLLGLLCCLWPLLAWSAADSADAGLVAVPVLTARVTDLTGTLDAMQKATLEEKLAAFETAKGAQVVVLLLPTTQPESIEQFGIRLFDAWKIGRKGVDDGALLIIAKHDRKLRIEVGYGLEGALNDATAKRIIDEAITPRFKTGDFAGGVTAGVDAMLTVIDGESLPAPAPASSGGGGGGDNLLFGLLLAALIVGSILRHLLGRLLGCSINGALGGVAGWLLHGNLAGFLGGAMAGFLLAMIGLRTVLLMFFSGRGGRSGGGGFGGGFSGGGGMGGGGGASGGW